MAYAAILSSTQQLAIALLGTQSQSSSFSTGKWISKPKLFKVGANFVLQIDSKNGSYYIQIQHNSISTIAPIFTTGYSMVDLKDVPESSPIPDVKPMQPMQPMKISNMSMDINSMSMQMGNMAMSLANQSKTNVTKQFCSQCGTQAKESDRFCRSCGHQLI